MTHSLTGSDIELLARLDLFDVSITPEGELEVHVYDGPGKERVPAEVWRAPFDPSRLSYLLRRIEKATIEMGWSVPRSLLNAVGYAQAAHEVPHWELVTPQVPVA